MHIATKDAGIANRMKAMASCMRLNPEDHRMHWTPTMKIFLDKRGRTPHRPDSKFSDFFVYPLEIEGPFPKSAVLYDSWRLAVFESDNIPDGFSFLSDKKGDKRKRNIDLEYNRIPLEVKSVYVDIFQKFILKDRLYKIIKRFSKKHFDSNTVSVHMRTWYDVAGTSRRKGFSLDKFVDRMKEFDISTNFFVASDSLEAIAKLKDVFGDRVVSYSNNKSRTVEDDIIDLYLLSKGKVILGTYMSTFTEVAWWLSGCNPHIHIL
tara:strand:- start:313 stop:1101 length:789 start_codon:yes stop_codon:yes gene_type:complete